MAIVTVLELRDHVQTDLTDGAVQRLLDDADSEIIRRLGTAASQVDLLPGGQKIIYAMRKASSITSIVEREAETDTTLAAGDYTLLGDGYRIERLVTGPNPFDVWRGLVTVTYATVSDLASRVRLEIDLVKLAVRYEALGESEVGDINLVHLPDYQAEREKLFRAFNTAGRLMII